MQSLEIKKSGHKKRVNRLKKEAKKKLKPKPKRVDFKRAQTCSLMLFLVKKNKEKNKI